MSPARKDESVETSLRELMQQEEERVRSEDARLEQLRAAKLRIDRERAEAAREEEERRRENERVALAELDARKAATVERARVEALAKADANRRAAESEERVRRLAAMAKDAPRPSRFLAGLASGLACAVAIAAAAWTGLIAPRIARAEAEVASVHAELDTSRARAYEARAAGDAALEELRRENAALRDENARMKRAAETAPPARPKNAPLAPPHPHASPAKPKCLGPLDPLCGDLDAR